MRWSHTLCFFLALSASVACTGGAQAQVAAPSSGHSAGKSLDRVKHQQSRGEAEVGRLERDVTRQQSDSEKASKRLQQQDEAIAELQQQLQELNARVPVDQH